MKENYPQIVDETFENKFIYDLSIEDYHKDKSSVSSTNLKRILKSTASFKAHHIDGFEKQKTQSLNFGNIVHMGLLEPLLFKSRFVVEPVFEGRTAKGELTTSLNCKEVKDQRNAWLASLDKQAVIVTEEEQKNLLGILESLSGNKDLMTYLNNSTNEASGYYRDPTTGILCRFRPDALNLKGEISINLKTCLDCSEWAFDKQVQNLKYYFSEAMTSYGIEQIVGKKPEVMLFVAVEKEPPYDHAIYHISDEYLEIGLKQYKRSMQALKHCLDTNEWAGYQSLGTRLLTPPQYLIDRELGL